MEVVIAVCVLVGVFGHIFAFQVDQPGPLLFYSLLSSGCFGLATYLLLIQ